MEWNHSEVIALARPKCAYCLGTGIRSGRRAGETHACGCVYRAIFKTCYVRFRECNAMAKQMGTVSLDWSNGPIGKRFYGRKVEEFMADFCCIAKRTLDDEQHVLFRYHYLLGVDFRLCCRRLKLPKPDFFYRVYKIEEILGKVFRELQPYPLFPLYSYFGPDSETLFGDGGMRARRSVKYRYRLYQMKKIA